MYKYELDLTRTVGATERTWDAERTDGQTDGRTDGRTDAEGYYNDTSVCWTSVYIFAAIIGINSAAK